MNKLLQYSALAAFVGAGFGNIALADDSTTAGGIKIKSDDGKFDFSIGGRVHFDTVLVDPDDSAKYGAANTRFGSNNVENTSGTYFRRVFLTLNGSLYGFQYRIEDNLAGNNCSNSGTTYITGVTTTTPAGGAATTTTTSSASDGCVGNDFQDVWVLKTIKHDFEGFQSKIWVGQHKPWRSMEEIGSNNNTLFMERPVTSASGIFGGRDFQQGVFYSFENPNFFIGPSVYSLHKDTQNSTQGVGYNARAIWAPINDKAKVASIGGSYSSDHADNNTALTASYRAAGYRLGNGTITDTFGSYGGSAVTGVPNSGGRNSNVDTISAEAVGIYGPFYLNAEYATAKFKRDNSPDFTVDAWYVQGSWFVTGEAKTFGEGKVVGGPKVTSPIGALELKVKYEYMENSDVSATTFGTFGNNLTGGVPTGALSPDKNQYHDISFGVNYYINPAMRFMVDYIIAQTDLGRAGKDEPNTLAARVQLAF